MPTLTIRADAHGLYVRTDGYIFRPTFTTAVSGTRTRGHHISSTSYAMLDDLFEIWISCGSYYDDRGRTIDSSLVPKNERWAQCAADLVPERWFNRFPCKGGCGTILRRKDLSYVARWWCDVCIAKDLEDLCIVDPQPVVMSRPNIEWWPVAPQ